MTIKTYTFEDGKYVVERDADTGLIKDIRRHGEPWPAGMEGFQFANMFHAALNRIDELEAVVSEVHSWIVCAPIATPEDMMQNANHIIAITGPGAPPPEPGEPHDPPVLVQQSLLAAAVMQLRRAVDKHDFDDQVLLNLEGHLK